MVVDHELGLEVRGTPSRHHLLRRQYLYEDLGMRELVDGVM